MPSRRRRFSSLPIRRGLPTRPAATSLPIAPLLALLLVPQVEDFTEAVRRHYWYEFFADDLPIWGFVGPPPEQTKDDTSVYIYTHKTLDIAYNGDRVGAWMFSHCGGDSFGCCTSCRSHGQQAGSATDRRAWGICLRLLRPCWRHPAPSLSCSAQSAVACCLLVRSALD